MIQIGDDYLKEAAYIFPEELKNNVLGLWRHHNIMSKHGKYRKDKKKHNKFQA